MADQTFKRLDWDRAVFPTLWWYGIRNVIVIGERRGRLTAIAAAECLNLLETLPIDVYVVRVGRTIAISSCLAAAATVLIEALIGRRLSGGTR